MHYRSPPVTQCRSALRHAHPTSAETNPQTVRTIAVVPVWLWLPLGQGEQWEADPVVWEVDESPASMFEASVTPECECDWSIEAMAKLPTLPPQPALPVGCPISALLTVSAA